MVESSVPISFPFSVDISGGVANGRKSRYQSSEAPIVPPLLRYDRLLHLFHSDHRLSIARKPKLVEYFVLIVIVLAHSLR